MHISKKKRIEELEKKLAEVEESRDKYIKLAADYDVRFQEMEDLKETIPEDCTRGPWCEACEFVKTFHIREYYTLAGYHTRTAYVCGKGQSCKNFVERRYEED